ncbi:uncharacterized protein F4822DRAFT_201299 [Hypoxylon trugodes]|uniref:uncharacterized protein n=1 Tax=Hypoxylon trugodes TaxID=326681 RepID=UPI0021924046|nr:uncharacterized protein F4822DRAFT_201299 [Hypoxylon trugodes]KAI1389460.1 hypothetical protein F4822DRAFT_201299 [Hypoxylon trugodes]
MASSTKARQPRLRASCDGCFLAKVKCSKARPICSRCLACGIECRYSPSSRAGKPKSEHNGNTHTNHPQDMQQMHHGMIEEKVITYSTAHQPAPEHMFTTFGTDWTSPPNSVDGNISRNPSISTGISLLGVEDRAMGERDPVSEPPEMYPSAIPWSPPTDLSCTAFDGLPVTTGPIPSTQMRSHSFDLSMPTPITWTDPVPHDMIAYSQVTTPTSMSSGYFPSPTTTPTMRSADPRQRSSPPTMNGGSCTCFTACLQSLQALHNASSPALPPFDFVLTLNRKAVEGCAAMLSCTKCMSRSGTHTAAMLLATVIGKITSFYNTASHSYFESSGVDMTQNYAGNNVGVSLGVYQLNGEDGKWLELEILARELRKLEEVYSRFREVVCADYSDVPEVTKAMVGYLGQNLGSTLEVISHRKGDMPFIT